MLGPVLRSELIAALQSASILLRQSMTDYKHNTQGKIIVCPCKIYTLFASFVDLIHYRPWTWRHQFARGITPLLVSQGGRLTAFWCLYQAGQNAKKFERTTVICMHRWIAMAKGRLSRPVVLTQHRIWSAKLSIRPCQIVRGCLHFVCRVFWPGISWRFVLGAWGSQYPTIPKIIYHKYPVSLSFFFFFFKYPEIVFGQLSRIPI